MKRFLLSILLLAAIIGIGQLINYVTAKHNIAQSITEPYMIVGTDTIPTDTLTN